MRRTGLLILLASLCTGQPALSPADRPVRRTDAKSATAHLRLLEKAKQGRIDIYFEGDSITRRWGAIDYPELLANWKEHPKVNVLLAGTNNVGARPPATAADVTRGIQAIARVSTHDQQTLSLQYGSLHEALGRLDEGLRFKQQALARDPLSLVLVHIATVGERVRNVKPM